MSSTIHSTLKNLKSRKLYLQVYDELKDYIVQNQLKPGDKLPTEMEMCSLLGVSRNVLREAIKSLEISGIVSSKPGVGMIIQEFNTDFLFHNLLYNLAGDGEKLLEQTLAVRRTLELGFMQEAFANLSAEDLLALQVHLKTMQTIQLENCLTQDAPLIFGAEFYEADALFHQTLFASTGNTILTSIISAVWACDKYHKQDINPLYMAQTVRKHEQIVSALLAQDLKAFTAAMNYHFNTHYKTYE